MARPLRVLIPGGIYHVISRGDAKQNVFLDTHDCAAFLAILRQACTRFSWSCLGYCLMVNHYHLIVRTPVANLSAGMRQLNGVYAGHFNRRHERPGHVWQGRFKSALIQDERYLFEALRYVVLNPVRARYCDDPLDWPWSSHAAVLGRRRSTIVNVREVLQLFGGSPTEAREAYRGLLAERMDGPLAPLESPVHGTQEFKQAVMMGTDPSREVPIRERCADRPPLDTILAEPDRERAVLEAYRRHGYTMREIAEVVGRHYTTISRWIRAAERREAMC